MMRTGRYIAHTVALALLLATALCVPLQAQEQRVMTEQQVQAITDRIEVDGDVTYYVRLRNGDILTGPVREVAQDSGGAFIRIGLPIGRAKVYVSEIAWVGTYDQSYRHKHRIFLLPTAEPIGEDHFLGLWELLFLYGGAGIGDVVSITGGRSFIPAIGGGNQLSLINAKVTVHQDESGLIDGGKTFYAIGAQGGWLQDVNFTGHIYGVATFTGKRTRVSTMMFTKISGKDIYTINGGTLFSPISFPYATGTIGIGLGMDSRFDENHGLHFLAEVWNADITRPSNTLLFLGLRIANTSVSMDFGMTVAPGPTAVPAMNFAWTPF